MSRAFYREHVIARPRSSLDRVLGNSPTSERELRQMASDAWRKGNVVVFFKADLERMPDFARLMVEGEAKRIYGER